MRVTQTFEAFRHVKTIELDGLRRVVFYERTKVPHDLMELAMDIIIRDLKKVRGYQMFPRLVIYFEDASGSGNIAEVRPREALDRGWMRIRFNLLSIYEYASEKTGEDHKKIKKFFHNQLRGVAIHELTHIMQYQLKELNSTFSAVIKLFEHARRYRDSDLFGSSKTEYWGSSGYEFLRKNVLQIFMSLQVEGMGRFFQRAHTQHMKVSKRNVRNSFRLAKKQTKKVTMSSLQAILDVKEELLKGSVSLQEIMNASSALQDTDRLQKKGTDIVFAVHEQLQSLPEKKREEVAMLLGFFSRTLNDVTRAEKYRLIDAKNDAYSKRGDIKLQNIHSQFKLYESLGHATMAYDIGAHMAYVIYCTGIPLKKIITLSWVQFIQAYHEAANKFGQTPVVVLGMPSETYQLSLQQLMSALKNLGGYARAVESFEQKLRENGRVR